MSLLAPLNTSSTEALLALLIDGKIVSDSEINEPIKQLELITDIRVLIEEVYLLSMYIKIHEKSTNKLLINQIYRIEESIKELDLDVFLDKVFYCKFLFSKVLNQINIESIKELESFGQIENLRDLDNFVVSGCLLLLMGMFLNNPFFYQEGVKIAELILDLINQNAEVDVFFFLEKGGYQKDSSRVSIFVLLSLYFYIAEDFSCGEILRKMDPYQEGLFQSTQVEKKLLSRLLEIVKPYAENCKKVKVSNILSKELIKLTSEKFSYITSNDKKVGIGSISYQGQIIVPSFGPHLLPLGRNDLYGTYNPICKDKELIDNKINMWSKVKSKSGYGDHWIFVSVTNLKEKILLESFIWSDKKEQALSLIFFLRAKKIHVGGKSFQSKGLERALVKANKIQVQMQETKMDIVLKDSTEIEIIPLAGQEYFWESDFIISLPFVPNKIISLEMLMD
jgi:hypothetical protein